MLTIIVIACLSKVSESCYHMLLYVNFQEFSIEFKIVDYI